MSDAMPLERHVAYAMTLLRRGVRPTHDALTAQLGGSRTTAQKALVEVWESRLPALLAESSADSDTPPGIVTAVTAIWREAQAQAQAQADMLLTDRAAAIEGARLALAADRETFRIEQAAAERAGVELHEAVRASTALAELRATERDAAKAEAMQAQVRADQADRNAALAARSITEHEQRASALRQAVTQAEAALEKAQAEAAAHMAAALAERAAALDAERATHAQAMAALREDHAAVLAHARTDHAAALDALKQAYHDSEVRLRLDIDALKTAATNERREAAKALERATQAAQVAALEAQATRDAQARDHERHAAAIAQHASDADLLRRRIETLEAQLAARTAEKPE